MKDGIREGRGGVRPNRSCVGHVHACGEITQRNEGARKTTHCLFLDVRKAHGIVWRNGLSKKLLEPGIRGKTSRMVKMMECAKISMMLDGKNQNI